MAGKKNSTPPGCHSDGASNHFSNPALAGNWSPSKARSPHRRLREASDATTTPGNRYVMTSDYVTTARTPCGKLVIAYLPSL
jgi:hypothetical protein